jgi:glyoxylase-like metal-dependent hydrolase (beta-lactamase superfamily II)
MIWSSLFSRLSAFVCLAAAAWLAGVCPASAQRAYTDLPVVKEGKTIRISPHVYVIPDENRRGVPNVGIVVGSRATLVIDPGMGLKSGRAVLNEATKISKGNAIILVTTHLHPEHITGIGAFPQESRLVRAVRQQQDIEENAHKWVAEFSERSPELA